MHYIENLFIVEPKIGGPAPKTFERRECRNEEGYQGIMDGNYGRVKVSHIAECKRRIGMRALAK